MPVTPLESWISLRIGLPRKTVLSRPPLREWQRRRLLETVRLARENSSWHRERLRGVELDEQSDPGGILRALPFTTAEDIRRHGREMLCVSQADIQRVVTLHTSGTSASPKRIFFTAEDLQRTREFFQYGMRLVTRAGSAVLALLPSQRPGDVGSLLVEGLREVGFAAGAHWPASDPAGVARAAASLGANCLVGMPQHLLALARAPEAARLAAPGLESILLCSDVAVPEARRAIAHGLGCRVHAHYGSTESGLGGAVECAEGAGCHIRENDLLFEVVDPDTGRPLPEGETGELVLTTLTRRGMPLLRYRTGDLGALEATRCACGSVLARLRDLRGRLRDTLRLAGGESLSLADLDSALLALPGLRAYEAGLRLAETEPGGQTTEILHVALLPATPDASSLEEAAGRALPALPAIERATAAGRLTVETALTGLDPGQSHTVKRHLRDQR